MKKRHIFAAVIGVGLEYYDYMLYMHFIVLLSPLFFPNSDPSINLLLGFASFALAYVARPLGGIVFGHIGDKIGRTKAMAMTVIFSTLGTFSIGLLPTYAQIGIGASILLVLFRCLQSFSVGGEGPGAACFLIESSTPKNSCLRSSYLNATAMLASMIVAFLGFLFTQSFLPDWAWRIPFLVVIFFGSIGFYIRYKLEETPEFKKIVQEKKILKVPLLEVIKKDKLPILCTSGLCAGFLTPFSILYVYLPYIIQTNLGLSISKILLMNSFALGFTAIALICMGILGDKIGARTVMRASCLVFILIAYPLFHIINHAETMWTIFMVEIVMSLIIAGIAAPLSVVLNHMFKTERRYSGSAFAWGIWTILFGGLTPLISKGIVTLTGNMNGPAFWLMFCCFAMIISLKYAPDVTRPKEETSQQKPLFSFSKETAF